MIVGIVLRNFKIYKSPTFIPVSNGERFCGLIGRNGVGKSSILEALDFYFNNRVFKQNINNKRTAEVECYVTPVFLVEKDKITDPKVIDIAESFSSVVWGLLDMEIDSPTFSNNYIESLKTIKRHIEQISVLSARETHYLLPIGSDSSGNVSLGIFRDDIFLNSIILGEGEIKKDEHVEAATGALKPVRDVIRSMFQYVYIPKDISPEKLTQFETQEIQSLLGKRLEDIVANSLPQKAIGKISQDMKAFIADLSGKIPGYIFRTPNERQRNIDANKIYALIIQEFFPIRELHKESTGERDKDISISDLSSGEKQQALFALIYSIISKYRDDNTKTLIVAVDEPESSLHISACYDQFEKLYSLCTHCHQVLFSSHWYGFIPAMNGGSVVNIVIDNQGKHNGHIFNNNKYREEIKHANGVYGRVHHQPLPIDVLLKSANDFIQSIVISTIEGGYNWLICEGSSDKVYLDEYFKDEIKNKKLRIIPVCSASEVKSTYNQLATSFESIDKPRRKGRVFLLTDTDRQFIDFETRVELEENLKCRRVVNDETTNTTILVKICTNPKSPNTDIEDTLNGKVYNRALLHFKDMGSESLDFLPDTEVEETASYFAMNLGPKDRDKINTFFDENQGNNKVVFAQKYIELMQSDDVVPEWIEEIKNYFD